MRGQYSLFNDFAPSSFDDSVQVKERKGRSERLHGKRNELLIHRYYYYVRIAKKQYLQTLHLLQEEEFFISERTIIDILSEDRDVLVHLHEQRPGVKYFRKKYPHLVW